MFLPDRNSVSHVRILEGRGFVTILSCAQQSVMPDRKSIAERGQAYYKLVIRRRRRLVGKIRGYFAKI